MKKTFTAILSVLILASTVMLSGCGENAADQSFKKFLDENDELVQSLLEPSEDWLNEPDGGEATALAEIDKVDRLLAGLGKLDKNAMSKKAQESYANIYDTFVALRAALESILEETRKSVPDGPMPGGYSEDREPEPDDLEIFEAVMAGAGDAEYEPALVATQVVAGINYRFTATATPTAAGEAPYPAYVYIHQPLDGTPELMEIEKLS